MRPCPPPPVLESCLHPSPHLRCPVPSEYCHACLLRGSWRCKLRSSHLAQRARYPLTISRPSFLILRFNPLFAGKDMFPSSHFFKNQSQRSVVGAKVSGLNQIQKCQGLRDITTFPTVIVWQWNCIDYINMHMFILHTYIVTDILGTCLLIKLKCLFLSTLEQSIHGFVPFQHWNTSLKSFLFSTSHGCSWDLCPTAKS